MGRGIANKDGPGPDCLPSFWFHTYNISTASSHWTAMAQPAIMGNSNLDWHESLYSTPSTARDPATLFAWHNKNDADQQSRGIQPPKPTWLTWKWCQSGVHGRSATIFFHDKIILQNCLCTQLEYRIIWPNQAEGELHLPGELPLQLYQLSNSWVQPSADSGQRR